MKKGIQTLFWKGFIIRHYDVTITTKTRYHLWSSIHWRTVWSLHIKRYLDVEGDGGRPKSYSNLDLACQLNAWLQLHKRKVMNICLLILLNLLSALWWPIVMMHIAPSMVTNSGICCSTPCLVQKDRIHSYCGHIDVIPAQYWGVSQDNERAVDRTHEGTPSVYDAISTSVA